MEVTLKRASEYARALGDLVNKSVTNREVTIPISIHSKMAADVNQIGNNLHGLESLEDFLSSSRQKFADDYQKVIGFLDTQYELRRLIGLLNHSSGIAATLTERARLDASIKFLEKLVHQSVSNVVETKEDIARQVIRRRQNPPDRYGLSDDIAVSLMTPEFGASVAQELALRKRQRMDVQDRLVALNLNTKVKLSDEIVDMLKSNGILA